MNDELLRSVLGKLNVEQLEELMAKCVKDNLKLEKYLEEIKKYGGTG